MSRHRIQTCFVHVIFFFTFTFAYTDTGSAQADFSIGFTGGLNIASMHGSDIDALTETAHSKGAVKAAVTAGFSLTYKFKKIVAIQSGASITGKGFRVLLDQASGSGGSAKLYYRRSINYFEVPLLFKTIFTDRYSKISTHLFAGPAIGFPIFAEDKIYAKISQSTYMGGTERDTEVLDRLNLFRDETYTDSAGNELHYTFDDFHRRVDISLMAGLAFEKVYGFTSFYFEMKYNQGLLNFNDLSDKARKEIALYNNPDTSNVIVNEMEAKFRNFSISIGTNIYIGTYLRKYKSPSVPNRPKYY